MKLVGAVITAAAVVLLAGCSSTPAPAPTVTVTAPAPEAAVAPTETAAPLVAETPAADATGPLSDEAFAAKARTLIPEIASADDASIVASAHQACDLLAQGVEKQNMQLIQGEEAQPGSGWYMKSAGLASLAATTYCPEYS